MNAIVHSNGEILTGRLWREGHPYFKELPFHSDIARLDEMVGPMYGGREGDFKALLFVSSFGICCPVDSNLLS
jgi:hypothetical protein